MQQINGITNNDTNLDITKAYITAQDIMTIWFDE